MSVPQALQRLIDAAHHESGGSEIIRLFLLSHYNGKAFPLDRARIEDVPEVRRMELMPRETEIHLVIPGTGHLWEEWRKWYMTRKRK